MCAKDGPFPVLPANQKELHWKARLVHPEQQQKKNQEWRKDFLGRWRNMFLLSVCMLTVVVVVIVIVAAVLGKHVCY